MKKHEENKTYIADIPIHELAEKIEANTNHYDSQQGV